MIDRLLKNNNIKNGIWLYLLQAFNTIIPLLTLPYVTRVLGRSGFGVFSIALNIITYLQVLVEYGFGMSATREVAISNRSVESISKTFTNVIFARLFLFFISITISILYLVITKPPFLICASLIIMTFGLIGNCVQQNWLFQGMQDMKYVSIVNIISRVISTLLVFWFVKSKNDILLYSFFYSISPVIGGFIGLGIAKRKYKISIVSLSIRDIKSELQKGWYVFTTQMSSKVFGSIGVTILGVISSEEIVGSFSAIQKIPNILMLAWMPISQVLYPIISQKMQFSFIEGQKYIKKIRMIILSAFIAIGIIISVLSNVIIKIAFGDEYVEYSYWVIPLLIWLILAINNNFYGIQTLLASGHDKEYSICFQISVVCTIVLNYLLIYFLEGTGAALAPMISELILSVTLIYQIRKIRKGLLT